MYCTQSFSQSSIHLMHTALTGRLCLYNLSHTSTLYYTKLLRILFIHSGLLRRTTTEMQTKFCDELRNHLDAYNEFTSIPTVMCELVLLVNMYIQWLVHFHKLSKGKSGICPGTNLLLYLAKTACERIHLGICVQKKLLQLFNYSLYGII